MWWILIAVGVLLVLGSGVFFAIDNITSGKNDNPVGLPVHPPSQGALAHTSSPTGLKPVECPITDKDFCTLLRIPNGSPCTFESNYVNDQCQMSCEAVIELFTQVGVHNYPSHSLSMGLSAKPPGTAPNQEACRLAVAMQQYGLTAQHNAGEASSLGLRNFYMSIGDCINQKYYC